MPARAITGVSLTILVFLGGVWLLPALNINSLPSHIDELRVFISCSKVDILIINESKLDSTIHDNELYLPGFEVVRRDRRVNGRKGGGVCIYLRTNLNSRIRGDLDNDNLECLFVEISMPRRYQYNPNCKNFNRA